MIVVAVALTGCGRTDSIDAVVKHESADISFPSGMFRAIRLPAPAPVSELVSNALSFAFIEPTNFTILETRQVRIHDGTGIRPERASYTAVLVDTSSGQKVVLCNLSTTLDMMIIGGAVFMDYSHLPNMAS